jgi:hypothetical protein
MPTFVTLIIDTVDAHDFADRPKPVMPTAESMRSWVESNMLPDFGPGELVYAQGMDGRALRVADVRIESISIFGS